MNCHHKGFECPGKTCDCLCDDCIEVMQVQQRSRRGKNNRAKGKNAQKEVLSQISVALGLEKDEAFSAVGGTKENDIRGSARFRRLFPFRIEVKNTRTVAMQSWIEQAEVDTHQLKSLLPFVVIFKLHGKRSFYLTLKLEEFLRVLRQKETHPYDPECGCSGCGLMDEEPCEYKGEG